MKRMSIVQRIVWGAVVAGCVATQMAAEELVLTARLVSPITSRWSKKKDVVTAIVTGPKDYQGDTIEGVIEEAKSSGSVKKSSVLRFSFQTLVHSGRRDGIRADLRSFWNSKGQHGVDEEGSVVQRSSSVGKAVAGAAIGAALGAIFGGARGAAIGAGAGLIVSHVVLSFAVKGPEITLGPDSTLQLAVSRCDACAAARAEGAYVQHKTAAYAFAYPREWQLYPDDRLGAVLAPPGALTRRPDGRVDVGYGAMVGFYRPERTAKEDLESYTRSFLAATEAANPTFKRAFEDQSVSLGGGPGTLTAFIGQSLLVPEREINLVLTTLRPEGLFFLVCIAPESRYAIAQQELRNIVQSLRFGD